MRKAKRHVYVVEKREDGAVVTTGDGAIVLFGWRSQKPLFSFMAKRLANFVKWFGQHSELRWRRKDGTIGETRTYPRASDPKRTKG